MESLEIGGQLTIASDTRSEILTIKLAFSAIDGPVVVAVVVDGALAVEQQAVLAVLLGQGAVGAEEEVVAEVRMGIGLLAMLLGTLAGSAMS